jgi:hypothetical protein
MKKVLGYTSGVIAEIICAGVLILIGLLISLLAL